MKNYINKISTILLIAAILGGCKKYEQFPVDKVTGNYVFDPLDSAGVNAQSFLYGVYAIVKNGHNRVGNDYLDAASDDAVSSRTGGNIPVTLITTNAVTSFSFPGAENFWEGTSLSQAPTSSGVPDAFWAGVRNANIFINNIGVVPVKGGLSNGTTTAQLWRSEARFLRAYFYFELVRRYGGVPLLGNKVYDISDKLDLPRSNFADCINYIVSECDAIKDSLLMAPVADADNYRATRGAAMALKAKTLLLAASPLFNGDNIDKANPLTGYTDYDVNRWTLAAQAAKDVMDLNAYSLNPVFTHIFLDQNNRERIFIRPGNNSTNIETNNGPVGFQAGGSGNTSPTQELVNAFPMQNGLPVTDPASGYLASDPYSVLSAVKRDPRFTATIFYNGANWLNSTVQTYEGGQSKPNTSLQQTVSGFYMRKFMGDFESAGTYSNHSSDWIVMRYAEILLEYAEARNEVEAAPQADVYDQLYALRARAGIDAGAGGNYGLAPNMTQAEMRAAIQNEWRIEFAFEEHRYFDIRRWKIAETVMNQPRTGVSVVKNGNFYTYNPITILNTVFKKNQYLYPIPYNEVAKNPNMKQNPGW
ncbi:RagB/SusD family nutrient uptake outer membrane protein [Chitinophaga oryziterrae]|uniref:RagB/SusD family nutrient uptake outer membrane protein n=1 Tax=Chitinophaga oryziterrae TaxID=1031224 RepID=A0A6N8JEL2_9BACT|nr:RagB/SusD family nutrient uptake outer membrane protein [Chitinophaga oryziterrae]MVT42911.1 RagB/SusD family nutrient uptake outer membrane protein [Chitinophaga oryziterrae]